jgi:16S rRNA C967 or C1407 C5-methylase (RsmB/RsmF family)/NOL1/NOP2/fmu family ribosome biogenesis protein
MKLPEELLQSLDGVKGYHREAFIAVHEEAAAPTSVRLNPAKPFNLSLLEKSAQQLQQVAWAKDAFYLSRRPSFTFDPLFHAGCYYVQEASSMFLEQAITQLADLSSPLKVLDLCAAPGGKSTHLQSLISPQSLLVSNEVIKPRSIVLTDNIIRWGCKNVFVTNNDPKAFGKLPGYFDVMVVDAPCSGSGLFRKDEEAIDEWSLHNVALCSQRQQRILADALPALKQNGLLVYSTCSYSKEEDEQIMDWLVEEMGLQNLALDVLPFEGIVSSASQKTGAVGYRFYPDKVKGEGFFLACFKKSEGAESFRLRPAKPDSINAKEKAVLEEWIEAKDIHYVRFRNEISAIAIDHLPDFTLFQSQFNLQYAGVSVGEVLKEKLVPHHALSQNLLLKKDVPATDLSYEEAIRFLQRQELAVEPANAGWQVVRYAAQNLGWINALKNRINNYYPKEIRILKARNDSA